MMMKKSMATASEISDFQRLVRAALRDTKSNSVDGIERCSDILRYMKSLNLSVKDLLRHSRAIHSLQSLRDHQNPKIRTGAVVLFNSWMKTLYSRGGNPPQMKKKQPPLKVSGNPKDCCPALKKNSTEMLELFEIAKKSADVANAKGLLLAKAETSISVDALSLLMSFPISSTATETRRIMERLSNLTRHKDRKVCNSASALVQHWSQSIRDQQRQGSRKTQG